MPLLNMASPAKKRKLNADPKSSPTTSRNLDFFFGKQRQNVSTSPAVTTEQKESQTVITSALTDEELARKLQAEWDQEATGRDSASYVSKDSEDKGMSTGVDASVKLEKAAEIVELPDENEQNVNGSSSDAANVKHEPNPKDKNTLSLQATGSAEDTITSNIPFDESPLTFEPAKYVVDLQGHWAAEGGSASYALLTRCFVLVNSTQSRIKIVDTLVNLLRVIIEGDPSSLLPTVRADISYGTPYLLILSPNVKVGPHADAVHSDTL